MELDIRDEPGMAELRERPNGEDTGEQTEHTMPRRLPGSRAAAVRLPVGRDRPGGSLSHRLRCLRRTDPLAAHHPQRRGTLLRCFLPPAAAARGDPVGRAETRSGVRERGEERSAECSLYIFDQFKI
jgi:hypothetical protein